MDEAKEKLESEKQIAMLQLEQAEVKLKAGELQNEDGVQALAQARKSLEPYSKTDPTYLAMSAQLDQQQAVLDQSRQDLDQGWTDYNSSYQDYETKTADAQKKIDDAQTKIGDIPKPDYYVIGRDTNIGYMSFENDSNIR